MPSSAATNSLLLLCAYFQGYHRTRLLGPCAQIRSDCLASLDLSKRVGRQCNAPSNAKQKALHKLTGIKNRNANTWQCHGNVASKRSSWRASNHPTKPCSFIMRTHTKLCRAILTMQCKQSASTLQHPIYMMMSSTQTRV